MILTLPASWHPVRRAAEPQGRWAADMHEARHIALVLTPFEPADAAVMVEGDRDQEMRKWFDFPANFSPSVKHSQEVVSRWQSERAAGTRFSFAIRNALTYELLGGCELTPQSSGAANLSYWTYPPHRKKGIATRAVRLLCEIAFNEMGIPGLELVIDPANTVSRLVATAAGFSPAGTRSGKLLFVLDRKDPGPPRFKGEVQH